MKNRRRFVSGLGAAGALSGLGASALYPMSAYPQEGFPSRPLRCVVAFAAGGVLDITSRLVTEKMSTSMGQPIIVDNRAGASGNIGTDWVLRTPADGYTFMACSPYLAINPSLMPTTKWATSEFTGIGLVGAPPNVFVVPPSLPVRTMKELIEYAKARPRDLSVTNPGIGSSNHLGQELLFSLTGIEVQNVMYKTQADMLPDLINGLVHVSLVTLALAGPHIREGKLRALAISAPRRSPDLPDVPTIAEAGYPDAMFLPWFGFVASAATPRPLVRRLSDEVMKALSQPDLVARLEKMGTQLTPLPGEEFDKLIASEQQRWAGVIKARNIRVTG
jgi:tripartite-type tricarboxylate transporter receptor subunit TctC